MEGYQLIVWRGFAALWLSFLSAIIFSHWGDEEIPWFVGPTLALCWVVCFLVLVAL